MKASAGKKVLMLIENSTYPFDIRVKNEALTLIDDGYAVYIICQRGPNESRHEILDKVLVYRYPSPPKGESFLSYFLEYSYSFIAMFFYSLYVWIKHGFHIIHTANPPDTAVFLGLFYRAFGKKFIFDHHDLVPELYLARSGTKASRFAYKIFLWLEKVTYSYSDVVIATNQSYKQIAMERGRIPEHRIFIVRNGPDLEQIKLVAPDPELKNKGVSIIGYVGLIGVQDGLDYFIRALGKLKNELGREDFYCLIIGKGNILSDLNSLSQQLGLDNHVRFTGYIPEEVKLRYLSTIDVGVVPDPANGFNEFCTMVKMMEYMTLGKPIVAFDLQEHRFTAQYAAMYAKPNDEYDFAKKLSILMDNPDLRRKMGEFGRERIINTLAWKHQASNLLEAYNCL